MKLHWILFLVGLLGIFGFVTFQRANEIPNIQVNVEVESFETYNGKLYYKNERFSGYQFSTFKDGKLASLTPYLEGVRSGKAIAFYPNGQKKYEKFYKNGKRVEVHTGWYATGQVRFINKYKNDLLEGEQKDYFENGVLARVCYYVKGKEQGSQQQWDETGKFVVN